MLKLTLFILILFLNFSSLSFADEFGEDDIVDNNLTQSQEESTDPLYFFNKGMFYTYKGAYKYGIKYIAIGYNSLPLYVKDRMLNFSNNVKEPTNMINHFLQLRINSGLESFFRFTINSTLGFFGMWDIMTALGMPKKQNDFGATLYFYGVPPGPYIVFFGPNNLRDSLGILISYTDRWYFPMYDSYSKINIVYNDSAYLKVSPATVITVVFFADYYRQNEYVLGSSFDEYSFIKDIFIQTRKQELQKIASYD